jgi:hypothetical protein
MASNGKWGMQERKKGGWSSLFGDRGPWQLNNET